MRKTCTGLALAWALAAPALADTFTASIVLPNGNHATPGQPLPIEIHGVLTNDDPGNDGLAFFSVDLAMEGPQAINLSETLLLGPPVDGSMDLFVQPLGFDAGYGGTGVGDLLLQAGGAQNTIGNDPAAEPFVDYPSAEFIAFNVAHADQVLLQGTLTLPEGTPDGTYTLSLQNVLANVMTDGQSLASFGVYMVESVATQTGSPAGLIVGAITGDLNGDGVVNAADLALLLGAWGPVDPCPPTAPADLNGDCSINAADLALLLGNWS